MERKRVVIFIFGFIAGLLVGLVIAGIVYVRNRDREIKYYAEKQIEIEALREGYINLDPHDLFDDIPSVRRAADGAAGEFDRKRDEILQRFRGGLAD